MLYEVITRLNPDVDDVVERFGARGPDGVRILVMGDTVQPAAGCLCPENALLASVTNSLSLRRDEAILMDVITSYSIHYTKLYEIRYHS